MDELERRIKVQEGDLKLGYAEVKENLRLKNVLRNKFQQVAQTPEIQRTLINTALGMVLGYTAHRISQVLSEQSLDRTVNSLHTTFERAVNDGVTKLEQRNPQNFLSKVVTLLRKYTPPDSPIYPFVGYRSN
jgi:hypothetical protein